MGDQVTESIIVKASTEEVYSIWSNFELFPKFMRHIESVEKTGPDTSHWKMKGPLGMDVKWDAYTTRLDQNQRVAWSSKDNKGDVTTSGQAVFTTLPDGETLVTVTIQYEPNKGFTGDMASTLFTKTDEMLVDDLRNFKSYIEGMEERIKDD